MNPFKIFLATFFSKKSSSKSNHTTSLYDIEINGLNGDPIQLADYKNKNLLFVNVASKCGFTPQYKDLQELQDRYKESLIVIGVPCNQFGQQESGNADDIQSFCEVNYGVTFQITEKIKVKGDQQHPLYKWLTQKELNGVCSSTVKWNFQKYVVDENGDLIDYFYSATNPLNGKITKHFKN